MCYKKGLKVEQILPKRNLFYTFEKILLQADSRCLFR